MKIQSRERGTHDTEGGEFQAEGSKHLQKHQSNEKRDAFFNAAGLKCAEE